MAQVVKAYLTHSRTPLITEELSDGRIRKVRRRQLFIENGWPLELKSLRAKYGKAWKGVRVPVTPLPR